MRRIPDSFLAETDHQISRMERSQQSTKIPEPMSVPSLTGTNFSSALGAGYSYVFMASSSRLFGGWNAPRTIQGNPIEPTGLAIGQIFQPNRRLSGIDQLQSRMSTLSGHSMSLGANCFHHCTSLECPVGSANNFR